MSAMVAQGSLLSSHQPWPVLIVLILPSLMLVLMLLPSPTADAKTLSTQAGTHPRWGVDLMTKADLIDQTPRLMDDLPWRTVSSLSSSESASAPNSTLSLDWIRKHLGTKSPYPHESKRVSPLIDTPEGYELSQLHLICRHGTRYPSSSRAIAYQKLTKKLREFDVPGFEWLRHWRSEDLYPITKGNLLAAKGDSDLYQIGRRFAIRYKDLLDRYPYDANTYEFQSSNKVRCSQSAYAFSLGYFEGRYTTDPGAVNAKDDMDRSPVQPVGIATIPVGMDKELAVKYACPRWLESVKDGPTVVHETLTFNAQFLPKIREQLSAIFSLDPGSASANITVKDVELIYSICGFEVALYNNDQTWCQLLRQGIEGAAVEKSEDQRSNFMNFEISGDLDDYYSHGPGIPFNRHLGCVLATTLGNSIELALDTTTEKFTAGRMGDDDDNSQHPFRGLFKFGHSETILFFSSFLRLYDQRRVPLKSNMTMEQYEQREFWTSKISPFAANMAFEVYRPKTRDVPKKRRLASKDGSTGANVQPDTPSGLIRLLVNEEPMLIPGCGSAYFCEWATLKKILQQAGMKCDFDECCTSLQPPKNIDDISMVPVCLGVNPDVN
ncbi:PHOsphatase [Modicella reniformis]|uniref:Multiple inositol polyphosphate phosphatase 1 n=1 Tax=Modicella reniformis TaxID=1440133 RepID=A0A9P6MBA9_9FUNG|nr:PHOsphatase [Modicella reniformis]